MRQNAQTLKLEVTDDKLLDFIYQLIDFERRLKDRPTLGTLLTGLPMTDPCQEWKELKTHPAFVALFGKNSPFGITLIAFVKQRKSSFAKSNTEQRQLLICIEEERFVNAVAFNIYHYLSETKHPELIKEATARSREQAANNARKILQLMHKGARLVDIQQQTKLRILLEQYVQENETPRTERPRNDGGHAQRLFVTRISDAFRDRFNQPFTAIIHKLAAAIGYTADERNLQKLVSAAGRARNARAFNAIAHAFRDPT